MTQFPLFSIVIPTYNRAALILGTLQSIWQQTYPHYEVIVVDNCSTDNTVEVLEPYIRTQRIKFIQHERNFERARSRNTGMSAATGDFLTFLDSDDLMYPNIIEDPELSAVYAPHLKTIEANSMIYLATLANATRSYKLALSYLYSAAKK